MTRSTVLNVDLKDDDLRHAVVCTLSGKLVGKPEGYEFLEEVRRRIDIGQVHVVVDLANVDRVDSTGVGILASIYTSANRRGGRVFVVNADDRAREILTVMRLFDFLETAETAEAALGEVHRNA